MTLIDKFLKVVQLPHPNQRWGCLSLAQHGDDFMLINLFELLGIDSPTYLDLGAHSPFIISNTALLYERGAKGVNVEANPHLFEAFKIYRPHDINLNIGVGTEKGKKTFFMFSDTSGLNTFSEDEVTNLQGRVSVRKTIELEVTTIDDIVEKHCGGKYPDLLLTDLEGLDFDVINSADFSKSMPKVIVAEVRRGAAAEFKTMLENKGYFVYCRMGENLFFIQNDLQHLVY
jgi:FkbM family methyltransferase